MAEPEVRQIADEVGTGVTEYAVEFAAVAAIARQLGLSAMRLLCWPLLAAVVVRFVLNPEVLRYPLGAMPLLNSHVVLRDGALVVAQLVRPIEHAMNMACPRRFTTSPDLREQCHRGQSLRACPCDLQA